MEIFTETNTLNNQSPQTFKPTQATSDQPIDSLKVTPASNSLTQFIKSILELLTESLSIHLASQLASLEDPKEKVSTVLRPFNLVKATEFLANSLNVDHLTDGLTKIHSKFFKSQEDENITLKDKLVKLEAQFESHFRPNKTICLQIPQTRRPKLPEHLDAPDNEEDKISIKSFRPDEEASEMEVFEEVMDRKIDKLDGMIEGILEVNKRLKANCESTTSIKEL